MLLLLIRGIVKSSTVSIDIHFLAFIYLIKLVGRIFIYFKVRHVGYGKFSKHYVCKVTSQLYPYILSIL